MFLVFLLPFAYLMPLVALEVTVNTGMEEGRDYSVMHLVHDEPFACEEIRDHYGVSQEIICRFEKRPSNKFTHSENLFFRLTSNVKGQNFNIHIIPKKKVRLFPLAYDLTRPGETIKKELPSTAAHWQVIGYEETLPNLQPKTHYGINFPITMDTVRLPAVGALDISKKPLEFEEGQEVPGYLRAKALLEAESFEQAIYAVDAVLREFPDTIFKKDLLLFKLRALDGLGNDDNLDVITDIGKTWIKQYPADEAVAEVLLLMAKSYNVMGLEDESKYYFNRIFYEHPGEKQEKLAKIALADILYDKGDDEGAMRSYQEALVETDDQDVASEAAIKMADKFLKADELDLAIDYYNKVLEANPDFFVKQKMQSYEWSKVLVDKGAYAMAARIGEAVLGRFDKNDRIYDQVLRDVAVWLDEADDLDGAYRLYSRYLTEFPVGKYAQEIEERLDRLLFRLEEDNVTKKMAHFDHLITTYADDEIATQARLEKAKIYFGEQNYTAVLQMRPELQKTDTDENGTVNPEIEKLLDDSAMALTERSLAQKDCKQILGNIMQYQLALPPSYDLTIYECMMDLALFESAKTISEKRIFKGDPEERLAWLLRHEQVLMRLKDYEKVIGAIQDILELAQAMEKDFDYLVYDLFIAYNRLDRPQKILEAVKLMEEKYPESVNNLAPYRRVVEIALDGKDDLMVTNYARKILAIQARHSVRNESPWIDFVLLETLIRREENNEALVLATQLAQDQELSTEERVKALYRQGFLYQKLSRIDEAKAAFERCSALEVNTPWSKLCRDTLNLLP